MKKKIFLLLLALPLAVQGFAQTDDSAVQNIDFEEDTTQTNSLKDIIAMQELVFEKNYRSKTIQSVWKHKKFLSLSYAGTTLSGKNIALYDPEINEVTGQSAKYKSDWGLALKRSQVLAFHKKPIAEMLSFGLEYSFFDISFNHFSKDKDMLYNSDITYKEETDDDDDYIYGGEADNDPHYLPWGSDMYNIAYAIHLGPSITLAPFTKLNSPGLALIRLQGYFTVGYRASLLWMNGDSDQDVNQKGSTGFDKNHFDAVDKSSKITIGHGLVTTWGIRLNWKNIGIGYEVTSGKYNYQSLEKSIYGSKKYKFTDTSHRISISYIW